MFAYQVGNLVLIHVAQKCFLTIAEYLSIWVPFSKAVESFGECSLSSSNLFLCWFIILLSFCYYHPVAIYFHYNGMQVKSVFMAALDTYNFQVLKITSDSPYRNNESGILWWSSYWAEINVPHEHPDCGNVSHYGYLENWGWAKYGNWTGSDSDQCWLTKR